MASVLEKMVLVGLGAWNMTREKVNEVVNELVREEGVDPEEARKLVETLVARGEREREEIREMIGREVERVRPVTRKEFEALSQRVDGLAARVEELLERMPEEEG